MRFFFFGIVSLFVMLVSGCASKPDMTPKVDSANSSDTESFSERALKEKISDSLAIRPSWTYYQYALQAMDNQEWLLARHYLDESLRQLVSERFDSTYKNVSAAEDSAYRAKMPLRIVRALDEVYPNVAELGENAENFVRNEVSIEGVDALDESEADSASLQVIESFLDTLDVSQFTLPVRFNERVLQEIYYMTNSARAFMSGSLNRKTAYDSLIYAQLDAAKMPRDLIYLALVESGFKLKAYSRAKASGMWQFIPETGKRYGLEVDYWVDMRRNPELATMAALKYLNRLHDEFGDWLLAMAAYNCGEGRVRRLLREMQADSTRDTSVAVTYWDLELPKETMRYVPRILAAMVIGHYPEQYEMTVEQTYRPDFDTVTVFDSFPLEEVAKLLKVTEDTLRSLNMELVKWCTPPNKESYLLRLPVGTRTAFVDGYDKMEKNSFSSWHHHKVRKGENLGVIARQYGIKVSELQQANDMKSSRIRAGQTLLIPIKVTPKPKSSKGKKPHKVRTYIVQSGDDVASVARKFGISQDSVRAWNSLDVAAIVKTGDTLVVSKPEPKPQVESDRPQKDRPKISKGAKYAVREGDTFADIAKSYGVPVVMLMQVNQGFSRRLTVGDSLVIPEYVKKKAEKKPAKSESKPAAKKTSNEKVSVYVVQQGDNLSSISRKFGTSVAKIQELNSMGKSTSLSVGQKLKVASAPEAEYKVHTVKKGEGLWDIARQYNVTIEDIVKWNDLNDTKIKMGEKLKIKK
ncbi:membrane-bound lytic murein transglycosylase D [Fibrobacter sp. UWOV1]|uniref:LysM peptidoglycan-binding domain-containing protein n=1 Tax=Fibrobacter sp. UWOV1 TaxID=1896215 RepID=UPI0009159A09|nr:LysM peptidoglycan-binding domain-containing protein [Fibrobacter sp. UWOV1]SHL27400.1 membrane-bound lytic murein transglycosylase D [Fibrobacter sp. UWOV1]